MFPYSFFKISAMLCYCSSWMRP